MRAANEDGKGKKQRESRSQLPNTPNQEYRVEMIFKCAHHVFRFTHWQEMMAFPASFSNLASCVFVKR